MRTMKALIEEVSKREPLYQFSLRSNLVRKLYSPEPLMADF